MRSCSIIGKKTEYHPLPRTLLAVPVGQSLWKFMNEKKKVPRLYLFFVL